jgi:hypothetical protein
MKMMRTILLGTLLALVGAAAPAQADGEGAINAHADGTTVECLGAAASREANCVELAPANENAAGTTSASATIFWRQVGFICEVTWATSVSGSSPWPTTYTYSHGKTAPPPQIESGGVAVPGPMADGLGGAQVLFLGQTIRVHADIVNDQNANDRSHAAASFTCL